jgi:hypothetical protein
MSREGFERISGAVFAGLLALASLPGAAWARTETIRWTYPDASRVSGFRVHVGSSQGSYTTILEVGKPAPVSGVYSATILLGDSQTAYAVVSGYNGTQASPFSNVRLLAAPAPPPTEPPPTEPPPTEPPPTEPPPTEPPPTEPPPPGNATWSSGFETYTAGDDPDGWVDTRANNGLTTDDRLFGVATIGTEKVFGTSSTETNIHSHFLTSESRAWDAYEFRGRMRTSHADGGLGITALSQYPQRDAYYRVRRLKGASYTAFHMAPHPDAKVISCSSKSTGVSPSANTWYRFRFQVDGTGASTVVRAKVWKEGGAEPSSWQIDCNDTGADRLRAGAPGVWSMGPGAKYWDSLEILPLGDSALPPETPPPGAPASPILLD